MNKIEQPIMYGWYLREDFNPEPIQSLIDRDFKPSFIEEMKEAGNFFETREEAEAASKRFKDLFCPKRSKGNKELRMWCIEHPSNRKRFFELYDWLAEVEGKERELRKFCVSHEGLCIFKTLEEALEWVKTGLIPDWILAMYEEFDKTASQAQVSDK